MQSSNPNPNPDTNVIEQAPLSPADYPLLVKIFAVLVVLLLITSIVGATPYLLANRQLSKARSLSVQENYPDSAKLYLEVVEKFPFSVKAREGAAAALFSQHKPETDLQALDLLSNCTFDDHDWETVKETMPEKYQSEFQMVPGKQVRKRVAKASYTSEKHSSDEQEDNN